MASLPVTYPHPHLAARDLSRGPAAGAGSIPGLGGGGCLQRCPGQPRPGVKTQGEELSGFAATVLGHTHGASRTFILESVFVPNTVTTSAQQGQGWVSREHWGRSPSTSFSSR